MEKLTHLDWPLILGLGALALVRPLARVTGLLDGLGALVGPLLITLLVFAVWVATVVLLKVREPLLTLAFTGVASGVFVIGISAALSPALSDTLAGPITQPAGAIAVLASSALWGALAGLVALALQRARRQRGHGRGR